MPRAPLPPRGPGGSRGPGRAVGRLHRALEPGGRPVHDWPPAPPARTRAAPSGCTRTFGLGARREGRLIKEHVHLPTNQSSYHTSQQVVGRPGVASAHLQHDALKLGAPVLGDPALVEWVGGACAGRKTEGRKGEGKGGKGGCHGRGKGSATGVVGGMGASAGHRACWPPRLRCVARAGRSTNALGRLPTPRPPHPAAAAPCRPPGRLRSRAARRPGPRRRRARAR